LRFKTPFYYKTVPLFGLYCHEPAFLPKRR